MMETVFAFAGQRRQQFAHQQPTRIGHRPIINVDLLGFMVGPIGGANRQQDLMAQRKDEIDYCGMLFTKAITGERHRAVYVAGELEPCSISATNFPACGW